MIKKDLKLWVNVGKDSLKLRKMMADHLDSLGIDGERVGQDNGNYSCVTVHKTHTKAILERPWEGWGQEITVAEFFNLTEADLKEPKTEWCTFDAYADGMHSAHLTQDQIDRIIAIMKEGES